MVDIQYGTTIMGGREVSRPYRVFRRRRAVFYVFVSVPPSIYPQNRVNPFFITDRKNRPFGVWEGVGGIKKASLERRLLVTPEGLEPSTH